MALTCTALNGIAKGCDANVGGITSIWLYDSEGVTSITDTSGVISAMVLDTAGGGVGQAFVIKRNTSSFTEEAAIDLVNGSTFITQTINLMFHRREATKSYAIQLLAEGQRDLTAIVLDANGIYWVFDEVQLSAVGEGSGQAKADGSKYSLSLTGESADFAGTAILSVLQSFDSAIF
jgi:hypothetical protein